VKIQVLTDAMASRIAAGEVVERPGSVVKELVENALDAGATEISIAVEKSGTRFIRLTDNGEGMEPEDLALAVERHSTSKLKEAGDLFHIATLGFRGEALPSIAAVSKLEIVSRPRDADTGYRIAVRGGKKEKLCITACPPGTRVEVEDIFFNTPARRKFLKSPATELSHICDAVNRAALAFPRIHFCLAHDGRAIADYVAVRDEKDRLGQVLGREIARQLVPFSLQHPDLRLHGYLSVVPLSFPNSRYLFSFVNGRYVRDKVLHHAVLHGYETLLMKGRFPAVVLFVNLPFTEVDVNVHPAKYEVRFRHQSEVHDKVSEVIREALKQRAKEPLTHAIKPRSMPLTRVTESYLPYDRQSNTSEPSTVSTEPFTLPAPASPITPGFFSAMEILGQILGCYLVCSSSQGLVLIDQHAAHERVVFEKLRHQMAAGKVAKQSLLLPQVVELSAGERLLLETHLANLARWGFDLEPFGPNGYAITAAPSLLREGDYRPVIQRMVAELADVDKSGTLTQHLEERLATIACHSVIRAQRQLEMNEMRALLQELDRVEFATQCPHGRPVLVEFSREELEKMFKRVL
jgi:DNA mismatch repair protein MutL